MVEQNVNHIKNK